MTPTHWPASTPSTPASLKEPASPNELSMPFYATSPFVCTFMLWIPAPQEWVLLQTLFLLSPASSTFLSLLDHPCFFILKNSLLTPLFLLTATAFPSFSLQLNYLKEFYHFLRFLLPETHSHQEFDRSRYQNCPGEVTDNLYRATSKGQFFVLIWLNKFKRWQIYLSLFLDTFSSLEFQDTTYFLDFLLLYWSLFLSVLPFVSLLSASQPTLGRSEADSESSLSSLPPSVISAGLMALNTICIQQCLRFFL